MSSAPEKRALTPGGGRETRAERARSEPMAVLPLGGGSYDVVTAENHVYTVDLPAGRCTCPDRRIRGARCKHLRRVDFEVWEGNVPAPGERATTCEACEASLFVPEDDPDPIYCPACTLRTGEAVVDRETGDLVVVVRSTNRRADGVPVPGTDHSIADHPTNEDYDPAEPLVDVVYPLPRGLTPEQVAARHLKRYSFPRARLERQTGR
ncbi:SWIM zinc finger family protein [Halobacteriaceae archaeon GCM10025711]